MINQNALGFVSMRSRVGSNNSTRIIVVVGVTQGYCKSDPSVPISMSVSIPEIRRIAKPDFCEWRSLLVTNQSEQGRIVMDISRFTN